jgi:hypothetical protein
MKAILVGLFIFEFFSHSNFAKSQNVEWIWAQSAGDKGDDWNTGIALDALNCPIVVGTFIDSMNFSSSKLYSAGLSDIFIAKYDTSGILIWAMSIGGERNETNACIATDKVGNIYIAACYMSDSIIVGNSFVTNHDTSSLDVFLLKLSPSGSVSWITGIGGSLDEYPTSICLSGTKIYLTGSYTSTQFSVGSSILLNNNSLSSNIFISKFDSNGFVEWGRGTGGNGEDIGSSLATAPGNGIFFSGNFTSNFIAFDSLSVTNTSGSLDLLVGLCDSSGHFLWVSSAGGTSDDWITGICSDKVGNCYLTGAFDSPSIVFGPNVLNNLNNPLDEVFVTALNKSGTILWSKTMGGTSYDVSNAICTNQLDKIYITGTFLSNLFSIESFSLLNSSNQGGADMFLIAIDYNGTVLDAKSCTGNSDESGNSIASERCNVYTSGVFLSPIVSFSNIPVSHSLPIQQNDIFLCKLQCNYILTIPEFAFYEFELFPNPTSNIINIVNIKTKKVKIYDSTGQLIYSNDNQDVHTIDLSDLSNGFYLISLEMYEKTVYKRLIIQH